MTLEGTNTWLVGRRTVLVVDPGPADAAHLDAVLAEVGRDSGRLGGVLLTHRHPDHAAALDHPVLQQAVAAAGAPVMALDPRLGQPPGWSLLEPASDERVVVLPLPGHTDDSLALLLPRRSEVLTGDTVLGRGTSVVAHPDGDLTHYLDSLDRLIALGDGAAGPWTGLPGHGPVLPDLVASVRELRAHRLARVEQVRAALAGRHGQAGPAGPADRADEADPADEVLVAAVVAAVYPEVTDPVLVQAASRTVRATLVHLARAG
ncbi:MBL fold metallo-hydrolase [Aquipuribacter sp. MA13-6]|uniref:MBL fold metallo-hydrolase n=1 Tax=unclassified Aquipuribacter TaxID=2635084 RepID=UPI003EEAFA2B